jgi:simple sugar transport system permease protein
MIKRYSNTVTLIIIFVVVFLTMTILSPDKFLSLRNFQSMAYQIPEFGLLSVAMFLSIITGGINLSTVNTATLSAVVASMILININPEMNLITTIFLIAIAIIMTIVTSILCGLFNGLFIGIIGIPSILVTLGTYTLFYGIALRIVGGSAGGISGFPDSFLYIGNNEIFNIPIPFIIMVVVFLIVHLIIKTRFGFSMYMIGSNPIASEFSGINNKLVLLMTYVLSGILCGIAAIIMLSRYNSAKADYGSSYLLQSILAVILGGASISGGFGKLIDLLISIIILQMISSGLNIFISSGINMMLVDIIWGSLIILVLAIDFFRERRKLLVASRVKSF